jgi:hypothetical protein
MSLRALLHVTDRANEGSSISLSNDDREDFLTPLVFECESPTVHVWALLDNHFQLLTRKGTHRISAIFVVFFRSPKTLRFEDQIEAFPFSLHGLRFGKILSG